MYFVFMGTYSSFMWIREVRVALRVSELPWDPLKHRRDSVFVEIQTVMSSLALLVFRRAYFFPTVSSSFLFLFGASELLLMSICLKALFPQIFRN